MSEQYLLDASALLALLQGEEGAEFVGEYFSDCVISSINLAEVASVLSKAGMPVDEIQELFIDMDLKVLNFDREIAILTGGSRSLTHSKGLSLGDRACLATAKQHRLVVLTADKIWLDFQEAIGISIELIR